MAIDVSLELGSDIAVWGKCGEETRDTLMSYKYTNIVSHYFWDGSKLQLD